MHIELDIRGSGLYYGTADDLVILPENDPAQVESLARWLGFEKDLDRWFTLEAKEDVEDVKVMFPTPCTVRKALSCYCDINGLPSKQLVSYLASYAEKSDEVRGGAVTVAQPTHCT
jgi:NADPH-ferrihemoprotein reductase